MGKNYGRIKAILPSKNRCQMQGVCRMQKTLESSFLCSEQEKFDRGDKKASNDHSHINSFDG